MRANVCPVDHAPLAILAGRNVAESDVLGKGHVEDQPEALAIFRNRSKPGLAALDRFGVCVVLAIERDRPGLRRPDAE